MGQLFGSLILGTLRRMAVSVYILIDSDVNDLVRKSELSRHYKRVYWVRGEVKEYAESLSPSPQSLTACRVPYDVFTKPCVLRYFELRASRAGTALPSNELQQDQHSITVHGVCRARFTPRFSDLSE